MLDIRLVLGGDIPLNCHKDQEEHHNLEVVHHNRVAGMDMGKVGKVEQRRKCWKGRQDFQLVGTLRLGHQEEVLQHKGATHRADHIREVGGTSHRVLAEGDRIDKGSIRYQGEGLLGSCLQPLVEDKRHRG